MADYSIFPKLSMGDCTLTEASVWVDPAGPDGDTATNLDFNLSRPAYRTEEDGTRLATVCYTLTETIASAKDDARRLARATVQLSGIIAIPQEMAPGIEADRAVRVAALAQMHPQAQAIIGMITALAPTGRLSVPSIDADGMVAAMDDVSDGAGEADADSR